MIYRIARTVNQIWEDMALIYKAFQDLRISALGMGTMRLPVAKTDDARIDEAATAGMVDYAMKHGVNYYDTAWGYHGGQSERVMGKVLGQYPRDSYFLATKFPGYDLSNMGRVEEIFEAQLEKCGVSYFDFYLFHNVCEMNIDAYLDERYGIFTYLMKQKESGRIRHLGFSTHGSLDVMKRFLTAYGAHMEFCQIQLNYVDWSLQDAKAKVDLLHEHRIPIWVMEPMRGGRLAKLSDADRTTLKALRPDETIPAWAFRFLQSIPGVTMTLTGASDFEQLKANIQTYENDRPLTTQEMNTLLAIADGMQNGLLACTACRYCTSHCPQGLDIPSLLALCNEHRFTGGGFIAPMALSALPEDKQPGACIGCGACEAVCPQQIMVSKAMADFAHMLNA